MANETVNIARIVQSLDILVSGLDGKKLAPGVTTVTTAFSDGTGDGQVTQVYADFGVDGTSTTHDLDGLTDFQGGTTAGVTKLKMMYFNNLSTTTSLTIGGGDFAAFVADASDKIVIPPESSMLIVCRKGGYTITATSADGLTVVSAAGQTYDMILFFS